MRFDSISNSTKLLSAKLLQGLSGLFLGFTVVGFGWSGSAQAQVEIPQTNMTPVGPRSLPSGSGSRINSVPGATYSQPTTTTPRIRPGQPSNFDPYATGGNPGAYQAAPPTIVTPITPGAFGPITSGASGPITGGPVVSGPITVGPGAGGIYGGGNTGAGTGGNFFGDTIAPPPTYSSPLGGPVYSAPGASGFAAQPPTLYGQGGSVYRGPAFGNGGNYPATAYPSGSPTTLFPGGLFRGGGLFGSGAGLPSATGGSGVFSQFQFVHGPRMRHTFINAGNSATDLEINDSDISVAFAFPNFLYSNQPLYVVPSFSLHLWDGPNASSGADLPANAYSGFLDFGWQTDPNQMMGLELGVRVGVFSEFDVFRSESLRVLGKGLASFRLTPATTFKAGVYYLDRNKIKLLPAFGWLWQPNPYTRADIFFPQPKFARYWRTLGTNDVWWYATGDYGGDSWTIERDNGDFDSIDINDIRIMAGFEWGQSEFIRAGRRTGFVEIGYVFDREVIYRRNRGDDFKPDDGFMVRAGIGY